jgi:hypothetical protein
MADKQGPRTSEWFVPGFGPPGFRSFLGLLFLPYTGMVLAFLLLGSLLAPRLYWNRLIALEVIYFLALGVGAHALDALGSKGVKPWGAVFTRPQLWIVALGALTAAYAIAVYYMVRYVPFLCSIAVLEGFFVFAYNMEWFGGRFHGDGWFAFSWGFLPVVAGYMMQTDGLSVEAVLVGGATSLFSLVEIKASRPYKDLKKRSARATDEELQIMRRLEAILKSISAGVILLALGLLVGRVFP